MEQVRRMGIISGLSLVCVLLAISLAWSTEVIQVISWNVESGDADPETVSQRIAGTDGVDLWGLTEVQNATWADQFETGAEDGENSNFETILGTTGSADRLLIIYDADRFELLSSFELENINIGGNVRAPLVAHLQLRATAGPINAMSKPQN